jgi:DNA-binding CsgD family transcriptional regulator
MANVNCTVYFREHGTSKIHSVEQAKGRVGSYGIRWYEGTRQRQKIIGQYAAAVGAKLKKELELKKARQKATSIVRPDESMKLDTAIEVFIREREDLNADSARRWRLELDLFKEQSGKVYLHELMRDDVFAYRKWYKDHGRSDNTIALRTSSLFTFGIRFNILFNLFTKNERKRLTLRTDGPVDYYTENDPYELKKFFAACDDEERLRFMFFLHTGAREKEVSFARFRDLDLTNRTFRIEEKTYDGRAVRTKNRKGRTVPIPQMLARFARSTKHLLLALEEFRSLGVQFFSYQENIDTSSPLGQALFTIVSAVAQLERDLIRERVSAGVRNARARGKQFGRPRRNVNQDELRRLRSEGASLRQIAAKLGIGYGTVRLRLRNA